MEQVSMGSHEFSVVEDMLYSDIVVKQRLGDKLVAMSCQGISLGSQ